MMASTRVNSRFAERPHTALLEKRIAHIAREMRALRWRTGKSLKVLAEKWGIKEQTVRLLSAEASKRVRAEVLDPDVVQATVGQALQETVHKALAEGDHLAVVAAGKTWNAMAVPVDTGGMPQFKSAGEMVAYIERILPALKEQAAQEARDASMPVLDVRGEQ